MKRSKALQSAVDLFPSENGSDGSFDVFTSGSSGPAASIIAKVLSAPENAASAPALVCWRTNVGCLTEQSVSVVKGLLLEAGDLVLMQRPSNWPEWIVTHLFASLRDEPARSQPELALPSEERVEVKVDGKRLQITAHDELVLQCGKASITLRRNGRLIIRGAYVESRSSGTHRIKGGAVLIN